MTPQANGRRKMIRKAQARSRRKLATRLENPMALVVEGFAAGCILIFTLDPLGQPAPAPTGGGGSVLSTVQV
jgi:hypothetical protein